MERVQTYAAARVSTHKISWQPVSAATYLFPLTTSVTSYKHHIKLRHHTESKDVELKPKPRE